MDKEPPNGSSDLSLLKRILQFFGVGRPHESAEELEQEIQELLDEGEEQGLISSREGKMITSILEFGDTITREIMTPRTQIACAPVDSTFNDLIQLITERGFTRIPIYEESPDQIIGILHAKDLLKFRSCDEKAFTLREIIHSVCLVLESQKIIDLLKYFQTRKIHMAVVTDEFGAVRGLVTLEDIIEEIVGEIVDESDKTENHLQIINDQTVLADARVNLEEIESIFDINLPEGDFDSLGGLIIMELGRLPKPNTVLTIGPLLFEVLSADNRRIHQVKISKNE